MKKIYFLLALVFFSLSALRGQQNIVKGRFFLMPKTEPQAYSYAFGVERRFARHFSAQVLWVSTAFSVGVFDGTQKRKVGFWPELRYYPFERPRWSPFLGVFGEFSKRELNNGEDCFICEAYKDTERGTGLVFGQVFRLFKGGAFEIYYGPKWGKGKRIATSSGFGTPTLVRGYDYNNYEPRIGCNFCLMF